MNGFKVTTKVVFKNKDGKVLILEKRDTSSLKWDLPGGTLETNEQINECIIRELNEELDIDICFNDLDLYNVYVVNRTKKLSLVVIVYTCDIIPGDITLSEEHKDFKYVNYEEAQKLKEDTVIFKIVGDVYEETK